MLGLEAAYKIHGKEMLPPPIENLGYKKILEIRVKEWREMAERLKVAADRMERIENARKLLDSGDKLLF